MSDIVKVLRGKYALDYDEKTLDQFCNEAADEIEKLRAALQSVLVACGQGRKLQLGAGGMTADAELSRTFIYGVPAWPIEEAWEALGEKE